MCPVSFRWLGVAGLEVQSGGRVLLIDPFFTRPRFLRLWFGRVEPEHALIARQVRRADAILVTHAHYDHLMDVPDVARTTGAPVFGSANTGRLLALCGVPAEQIHAIAPGDRLALGPFAVDVLPGVHEAVRGFAVGPLRSGLHPPLRLRDYRMDSGFTFLVRVAGLRLLHCGGLRPEQATPADVLFVAPMSTPQSCAALLRAVRPRLVVPVHWDDLFRPLSVPIRPCLEPPRLAWPPLRHMDPARFKRMIEQIAPAAAVLVPEALRVYECGEDDGP